MQFQVSHGGRNYAVTCPNGVVAGQQITIALPAVTTTAVATATPNYVPPPQPQYVPPPSYSAPPAVAPPAYAPTAPPSGKDLFLEATMDTNETLYIMSKDHVVDESNPSIQQYGIISVTKGTQVKIVEGDLASGLGGSLGDYVRVSVPSKGGKQGLVSRHVVKKQEAAAPPPAIGAVSAGPPPAIS
mmetsp:Transcript_3634/g.4055  ORF Transcript_3634/g.4055 Transcript_3634/m.4055 type:complete len:186 (+) Transcript_3634:1-558(+)